MLLSSHRARLYPDRRKEELQERPANSSCYSTFTRNGERTGVEDKTQYTAYRSVPDSSTPGKTKADNEQQTKDEDSGIF